MFKVYVGDREVAHVETEGEATQYILDYFAGDLQAVRQVGYDEYSCKYNITSDGSLFEVTVRSDDPMVKTKTID